MWKYGHWAGLVPPSWRDDWTWLWGAAVHVGIGVVSRAGRVYVCISAAVTNALIRAGTESVKMLLAVTQHIASTGICVVCSATNPSITPMRCVHTASHRRAVSSHPRGVSTDHTHSTTVPATRHCSVRRHLTLWRPLLPYEIYGYSYKRKHPVPEQVKPSFVIFWHPCILTLVLGCQKLLMTA